MASKKTEKTVTLTEENFLALLNGLKKAADILQSATGNILIGADLPIEEDEPAKPAAKSKAKKAPEPEPEEDDEDEEEDDAEEDEDRAERREELEAMKIAALRKIATDLGFNKAEVKDAESEDLIESILDEEFGDADDDEDEDDDADEPDEDEEDDEEVEEEDEDEESDDLTREDLEGMSLAVLRKTAAEYDIDKSDLKGLDKDGIIDLILGEGDVEDEDDEEDDEDEEEADEPYTKEELADMSLADLKAIAKEWDVKIKPGTKQAGYIKAILAAQDED